VSARTQATRLKLAHALAEKFRKRFDAFMLKELTEKYLYLWPKWVSTLRAVS
jgi:hypothetical protein